MENALNVLSPSPFTSFLLLAPRFSLSIIRPSVSHLEFEFFSLMSVIGRNMENMDSQQFPALGPPLLHFSLNTEI